tara:strand:- start:3779 stop:4327 length:549 start_codon:yes stop_codon:yes gene_type:complete
MSNIITYGDGKCSIDSSNIRALDIYHNSKIEIFDKTPSNFLLRANNKRIIIAPIGLGGNLSELFEYYGEFKIKTATGCTAEGSVVIMEFEKNTDRVDLVLTKVEDISRTMLDMNVGDVSRKRISETIVKNNIIENLSTGDIPTTFYLKNGEEYNGEIHMHPNGRVMTGATHTRESELLRVVK